MLLYKNEKISSDFETESKIAITLYSTVVCRTTFTFKYMLNQILDKVENALI